MHADVTDKFNVIQISQPVRIVYHKRLAFTELDETAHLLLEAFAVMVNLLCGHHGTKVASAGRVTNHTGTAANQGDGTVACLLQSLH